MGIAAFSIAVLVLVCLVGFTIILKRTADKENCALLAAICLKTRVQLGYEVEECNQLVNGKNGLSLDLGRLIKPYWEFESYVTKLHEKYQFCIISGYLCVMGGGQRYKETKARWATAIRFSYGEDANWRVKVYPSYRFSGIHEVKYGITLSVSDLLNLSGKDLNEWIAILRKTKTPETSISVSFGSDGNSPPSCTVN